VWFNQCPNVGDLLLQHRPRLSSNLAATAAQTGIGFGFATSNATRTAYPFVADLIAEHAGLLVDGSGLLFDNVHPGASTWSFSATDDLYAWTGSSGLTPVHAGHLVWDQRLPAWLTAITNPTTLRSAMEAHIAGVIGHFGSRPLIWNVTNEVIAPTHGNPGGLRSSHWYSNLGAGYVKQAFDAAAAAVPPGSKLVYNHDSLDVASSTVFDAVYAHVTSLLDAGARIDGIGSQMHVNSADVCSGAEAAARLNAFGALGLDVYVTEFDVRDKAFAAGDRAQQCADLALDLLGPICRDVTNLRHVICWDASDLTSWLNTWSSAARTDGLRPSFGNPFDRNGAPNPLAEALADALRAHP